MQHFRLTNIAKTAKLAGLIVLVIFSVQNLSARPTLLVTFNAYNAITKELVDAKVHIKQVETGEIVLFEMPTNDETRQKITLLDSGLTYQVFLRASGFEDFQHELALHEASSDTGFQTTKPNDSTLVVDIFLKRPKVGSKLELFHIYFWNNSHVLLPKPREDLETVLGMMEEDPKIQITIHGHTASNDEGPIVSPVKNEDGSWKVFTLPSQRDGNEPPTGSAKRLSELRAETVKQYLVQNGIEENRIEVEGHGADQLLFKAGSPHTHKNKRVEIELRK